MNYLQNSDGETIPVPQEVYLFKGLVSFLDFSVIGEFSTNFQIPNDSEIRKIIGFYSINQLNKITEIPLGYYVDGNKVSDGRLFIESVGKTFEVYFVGGNSNWMNRITGGIKDLDLSEYDVTFNATTVDSRKSATDGVVFPVIDWCYNYKKLSNNFLVKPISGVGQDAFYDFYPCFYVHTLIKEIFDSYGIKRDGNLFDDPIYKSIALTPKSIVSSAYASTIATTAQESMSKASSQNFLEFITTKVVFEVGTTLFNDTLDRLVFNYGSTAATFIFSISEASGLAEFQGTLYLYKNGSEIASVTTTSPVTVLNGSFSADITNGDYFELYYRQGSVVGGNKSYAQCSLIVNVTNQITNNGTVYINTILPDIDQFDLIKYVAQRFNCLIEFDEITQTIYFNLLDKISKTNAVDYSDKIVDGRVVPKSGYGERNYVRTSPSDELVSYKSEELNFGDSMLEGNGDGKLDLFTSILKPSETFQNFNLDWLLTNIPLIRLEDAGDPIPYTSVTNTAGNAIFNGTGFSFVNDSVVRVDGQYEGFFTISSSSATAVTPHATVAFGATGTGNIYKQRVVLANPGSREVIIVPSADVLDFSTGSVIYGVTNIRITDDSGVYPYSSAAWAYFAKPNINTDLDNSKIGLNYGPVTNVNGISFGDMYHKMLRKMVNAPKLPASFLLTQTEYYNLDLSNLLFLRTKDFDGYFLISKVEAFKNQFTPVDMDLILIE